MQPKLHRFGVLGPKFLEEKARDLFSRFRPRHALRPDGGGGTATAAAAGTRREITWQHLAATAPFRSASRRSRSTERYVDGGLVGALPLWAAEEMGATRAIALNCSIRCLSVAAQDTASAAKRRPPWK